MSLITDRLRTAGCVFAEDEAALLTAEAGSPDELEAMVVRRIAGEPLEQIVGWAEFRGLRIVVEPGVFVPRRRTEFLVEQAAKLLWPGEIVVDLCCGSGAIGAALRAAGPIELYAADLDPAAVRCARRNLGDVVYEGDMYDALPAGLRGRVGLLVANVPYVPTGAVGMMPPEARDHEARMALDGGADGLDLVRRYASGAPDWLVAGGHVLVETGTDQVPAAVEAFTATGLTPRVVTSDEYAATVLIGTRA
jgi:release factor glutamine methyltransferase